MMQRVGSFTELARQPEAVREDFMVKKMMALAIVIGASLIVAHATAPVTFIMTSGDRHVGDIASSSIASPSMPQGELNLERGTEELSFGMEQVAVIDYAGGTPSATELRALREDQHNVVLRNGRSFYGRLVTLRPDMLRFHNNEAGRTEEYRVSAISRIYLNTERARSIFDLQDASDPAFSPGQPTWGNRRTGEVSVPSTSQWIDTGLDVMQSDRLTFQAAGQIRLSADRSAVTGPGGLAAARSQNYPLSGAPGGALIGRIDDGEPFLIGAGRTVVTMPATGRLRLGINDDLFTDNSGTYRVRIAR
jgi:hypothetical protein